jgi:hypothetical protein
MPFRLKIGFAYFTFVETGFATIDEPGYLVSNSSLSFGTINISLSDYSVGVSSQSVLTDNEHTSWKDDFGQAKA